MNGSSARRAAALASAALLCAACKGTGYWQERLQADPLYRRADKVRESPSCAKMIPLEFGRTFPVPSREAKRFEILYYPLFASPGKSEALSPVFQAHFDGDAAADSCAPLAGAPSPARSVGAPVPAGLSVKAYYKAEVSLFASLDKTAALYFSGTAPSENDKTALGDYLDAFTTLAEPGLIPDYYRENPDFWEWLRRATGRSIPKPSA